MRQLRAFDPSKGGTRHLYCLQNVRLGFSIPPLFNDAWTAWLNTQQHPNRNIPTGVDVPLYYSFTASIDGIRKNWGHINVRYRDGRVWNDGRWFASLAAFEQAHSNVKYVGWGESVNNVKVIERASMTQKDIAPMRVVMSEVEGWNGHDVHAGKHDKQILGAWAGKDWTEFIMHGWNTQKTKRHDLAKRVTDLTATNKRLLTDNNTLTVENAKLKLTNQDLAETIKLQTSEIKALNKEIADLQAQLAVVSDDTDNLNKLGEVLRWFITRIGLTK